jgi:hypothetical protein
MVWVGRVVFVDVIHGTESQDGVEQANISALLLGIV